MIVILTRTLTLTKKKWIFTEWNLQNCSGEPAPLEPWECGTQHVVQSDDHWRHAKEIGISKWDDWPDHGSGWVIWSTARTIQRNGKQFWSQVENKGALELAYQLWVNCRASGRRLGIVAYTITAIDWHRRLSIEEIVFTAEMPLRSLHNT